MSETEDLYELLQIPSGATPAEIQEAYTRLVGQYHPDVDPSPDAESIIRRINQAYEILSDPSRRAEYDRQRPPTPPTEGVVLAEDSSDVAEAPARRPRRGAQQRDQQAARAAAPTFGPVFKAAVALGLAGAVAVLVWYFVSDATGGGGDTLGPGDGANGRTLTVIVHEDIQEGPGGPVPVVFAHSNVDR